MSMLNVIIGKGILEGPDYYSSAFADYLRDKSINVYIVDVNDENTYRSNGFYEVCSKRNTVAFTFNNVLFRLNHMLGLDFWKERNIPVFDYIVDHPRYYADTMLDPVCDLYVFALDRDHVNYISNYYPKVKGAYFSPNGGTKIDNSIALKNREIDVLYMGNCKPAWEFPQIDMFPEGIDFFNGVLKYLLTNPMLTTEDAIQLFFDDNRITVDNNHMIKINTEYAQFIENLVRRYYMLEAMKALDEAGVDVHVYGDGWVDEEYPFSDHIHLHGRISLIKLMNLIGSAKISLCFIPWFKNGCSEKNFDSMLNGCLVVSDQSGYLTEKYRDGYNIVYFDLNNPKQMAQDVKWLLTNISQAEVIAKRGYETAVKYDTWSCRFDRVMNVMQEVISAGCDKQQE